MFLTSGMKKAFGTQNFSNIWWKKAVFISIKSLISNTNLILLAATLIIVIYLYEKLRVVPLVRNSSTNTIAYEVERILPDPARQRRAMYIPIES